MGPRKWGESVLLGLLGGYVTAEPASSPLRPPTVPPNTQVDEHEARIAYHGPEKKLAKH